MSAPSSRLHTRASPPFPSASIAFANDPENHDGPHVSASTSTGTETNNQKSKSKGKGRAEGKTKVKEKRVHRCTYPGCDKTFITPAHVRRHVRTHTGMQPYACEFCEKRFARSDVRNRHMQLSHREQYDEWLATLPPDRKRQGSKHAELEDQVDDDGRQSGNSAGEDEDEEGLEDVAEQDRQGDGEGSNHSGLSRFAMDLDVTDAIPRHFDKSDPKTAHSRNLRFQNDVQDEAALDHILRLNSYEDTDHRVPFSNFPQHTQTRTPHMLTHTGLPLGFPAVDHRFFGPDSTRHIGPHFLGSAHSPPSHTTRQAAPRSAEQQRRPEHSHQAYSHHEPSRQTISGAHEDVETSRNHSEMLSRLDILLAAAAQPEQTGRGASGRDTGTTGFNDQSGYVANESGREPEAHDPTADAAISAEVEMLNEMNRAGADAASALPYPQNNPNSGLTPEAFIATTLSLNSGTIPSVVSGASPLDLNDMDFDMALYHDVFGWGLGAADWQQQAGGQGVADMGTWAHDMLDLSALNNPTEFVGGGVAGSGIMPGGPLSNFVTQLSIPPTQPNGHGTREGDPAQRGDTDVMPSIRASGRTTRQGTATPGNGEEETPWPHVFRPPALPFDRPLALPYAIEVRTDSYDSFLSSAAAHPQVSSSSHASIIRLVKVCHGASPWREPDYTNFPSTDVLSHCVGLYFNHFHPILPILRPAMYMDGQGTYRAGKDIKNSTGNSVAHHRDEAYHTLLTLTVAAIGAAYAEDRMKPVGGYLMELARRIGSYLQLSDPRSLFSIPYIQSRLLVAVSGYADGSRERYLMSEVSKGLLVTAARRLHLLRDRPTRSPTVKQRTTQSASAQLPTQVPSAREVKRRWREWTDEEERLRLGWAIYIFDAQAAAFLNVPASFILNEVQVRLPDSEEMWGMSNASIWDEANRSRGSSNQTDTPSPFGTILLNMIRKGRLQEQVSEFGKWILAHSLYRMCDDANMQNKLMGYTEPIYPPLSDSFCRPDQRNPFLLLGLLVNSWQNDVSFAKPSPFFASSNALRHYSNIRFIHPTFMDHVKLAAGKISVSASKESSQQWLSKQPTESVLRRIFVESIQLAVFLLHSRLDAPWEPIILLDCALSLWAILRFRSEALQLRGSSPGATIFRSGSRNTEYLERWITEGGPLKIQGMSYTMTPENVLTDFVTRLQDSPWGLSCLYAAVLNNLQPKEGKGRG